MVEFHEYRGLWWLPSDETEKLAGTLTITKGAAALELIGHFGHQLLSETERQKAYSLDLAEHPRVVGLSADGRAITLEGHQAAAHRASFPGIATATYRRNVALIGKQFADGEDIGFDEISIRSSDLNAWTRVSGFNNKIGMEKHTGKDYLVFSNVEMRFDAPDDIGIALARGESAFIRFNARSHGIRAGTDRIELHQEAAFHLRFSTRVVLGQVFYRVAQIRNFLSLAVGRPVTILAVTGYQDDFVRDAAGTPLPIELLWQLPYNPDPPGRARDPREMLFALPEATPEISSVMQNWFAKQERLAPVFNLFFGVRHHDPGMSLEVRFLLYAQAVETYDYRRRRKPGNRTLAVRMDDVLNTCRTVAQKIVGSGSHDQTTFIEGFKTARNYYTHYNPKLEMKAARGAALFVLFIQLQAIIEMSLLRELGFGCRSIDAILERARRYEQIEHFKAVAAAEEAEDA
jgi:ApeA-like protein/HEPN superfamily Apea-like protein